MPILLPDHIRDRLTSKKTLVTGAAGFIGSHLAAAIAELPCELTLVDSNARLDRMPILGPATVTTHRMSICDDEFFKLVASLQPDFILHMAGNANVAASVADPGMDFDVNLRATFKLLETLRRSESRPFLLLASSAAVYGNPVRLPIVEEDQTVPISPYGVAKLAMERYLAVYCRLYGLRGNSVRMFSPFGPRLEKQIVFELVRKLIANPHSLELLGDGAQTRDFLFVDDLIRALLHVATLGNSDGAVYNIGSGTATAVSVLAQQLIEVMGLTATLRFRGESMPGYPDHWRADVRRLEALGWHSTVPLRAGLAETVKWVRDEYPQH